MDTLRKFEGPSLDELLAFVYRECGESAQIIEANRVRRGGVGGFFAKEAYEVVVSDDGPIDANVTGGKTETSESMATTARALVEGAEADRPSGSPRAWSQPTSPMPPSISSRRAAIEAARARDAADGDELVGDVMGSIQSEPVDSTTLEAAISREAAQRLQTPRESGGALLGLVDEANDQDKREPISFAAALDQAMSDVDASTGTDPADRRTRPAETLSLDDLLGLELPDDVSEITGHESLAAGTEPNLLSAPDTATPVPAAPESPASLASLASPASGPAIPATFDVLEALAARVDHETDLPHEVPADIARLADDFFRQSALLYRETTEADPATSETGPPEAGELAAPHHEQAPIEVAPVSASPTSFAPVDQPTPPLTPTARPSVFDLIGRFERLPAAPPIPDGPGIIVVVGSPASAVATAQHLAPQSTTAVRSSPMATEIALASPAPTDELPAWSLLRSADEALERAERWQRNDARVVVAVDLGTGAAGLLWAKRLIDRLGPLHICMAVSNTDVLDDRQAAIELIGGIDAVALHTDGRPTDPDRLLCLGPPIATVDGHPTSAALWAALTLEGATHGEA